MKYYVYAIKSMTVNYIYVAITSNIVKRLGEHNKGKTRSNRNFKPFKLIYSSEFNTRSEARKEEKRLKSGYGKEYLKSL